MGFMTARAGSNTRVAPRFKLPSPPPSLSAWPEDGDTRDEAEQRTADMLLAAAQELRVQFPMEQAQELWGLVDGAVEAIELFQPGDNARARAEASSKPLSAQQCQQSHQPRHIWRMHAALRTSTFLTKSRQP